MALMQSQTPNLTSAQSLTLTSYHEQALEHLPSRSTVRRGHSKSGSAVDSAVCSRPTSAQPSARARASHAGSAVSVTSSIGTWSAFGFKTLGLWLGVRVIPLLETGSAMRLVCESSLAGLLSVLCLGIVILTLQQQGAYTPVCYGWGRSVYSHSHAASIARLQVVSTAPDTNCVLGLTHSLTGPRASAGAHPLLRRDADGRCTGFRKQPQIAHHQLAHPASTEKVPASGLCVLRISTPSNHHHELDALGKRQLWSGSTGSWISK